MYRVRDFYEAIDGIAPFSTAEKWDNVGLQVGSMDREAGRALLALDLTGAVLEEARRIGAALVITHHPVLFDAVKRLDADAVACRALAAGISVLSAHTNLDLAQGGVNDALAGCLGLTAVRPFQAASAVPYRKVVVFVPEDSAEQVYDAMAEAGAGREGAYSHCGFLSAGEGRFLPLSGAHPTIGEVGRLERVREIRLEMLCSPACLGEVVRAMRAAHPYEQPAYDILESHVVSHSLALGRIGELPSSMEPAELASMVRRRLDAPGVRFVGGRGPVATVAVCGGSGGSLVRDAARMGVDALVTGEIKHDHLLEAGEIGLTVVDAGHFATENVVMRPLGEQLRRLLPEAEIHLSECCTDGVQYST